MNKPLTLEQLREMSGKPYWHIGLQDNSPKPHWQILDPFVAKNPEDYSYGKTWLAYAYPPAHIDREAWTAKWVNSMPILGAGDLETRCVSCGNLVLFETPFCPYCGKAMTEEAWNMIERRLQYGEIH